MIEAIAKMIIRKYRRMFPKQFPKRIYASHKELVSRYCRGNVRLQMGQIVFPEELKKVSDRVVSYAQ